MRSIAPFIALFSLFAVTGCVTTSGDDTSPKIDANVATDKALDDEAAKNPAKFLARLEKECNEQNDSSSCTNLGRMYRRGVGIPVNNIAALGYYEKACNLGNPRGCSNLGFMYSEGAGVDRDYKKAVELFSLSCNQNDAEGCRNLAESYRLGEGVEKNDGLAFSGFQKACEMNNAAACNDLGFCYQKGVGTAIDLQKAALYFRKSCSAGQGRGCANVGYMHESGKGLPLDKQLAALFYAKGCQFRDSVGCNYGATLLERGDDKSLQAAYTLAKQGCSMNDAQSCSMAGRIALELNRAAKEQVKYFQKSCDLGSKEGCVDTAEILAMNEQVLKGLKLLATLCDEDPKVACDAYANRLEDQESPNRALVAKVRERACDAGDANGCSNYGWMLQENPNRKESDLVKARALYENACKAGSNFGCGNLGMLLADGAGGPKDEYRATDLLKTGCDAGAGDACRYLADFYYNGKGNLSVNKLKASQLNERACELGDKVSCPS